MRGMKRLENLGTPEVLVAPNAFHRGDAAFFKEKYPAMLIACPADSHDRVARAIVVDGACEDIVPPLGVTCHAPEGGKALRVGIRIPSEFRRRACIHRPAV